MMLGGSVEAGKERQMPREISLLVGAIEVLDKTLQELLNKLEPYSSPLEANKEAASEGPQERPRPEQVARVHHQRRAVEILTKMIEAQLLRLEL